MTVSPTARPALELGGGGGDLTVEALTRKAVRRPAIKRSHPTKRSQEIPSHQEIPRDPIKRSHPIPPRNQEKRVQQRSPRSRSWGC